MQPNEMPRCPESLVPFAVWQFLPLCRPLGMLLSTSHLTSQQSALCWWQQVESGLAALPSSVFEHLDKPCCAHCPAGEQPWAWGALAAMWASAGRSLRLLRALASSAGDECFASRRCSAPELGTTGNVVTPAMLPCTFGRSIFTAGLASGFRGGWRLVCYSVDTVWF